MPPKRLVLVFIFCFLPPLAPALGESTTPSYVELHDTPTITVDWSKGSTQAVTLHGNRTLAFRNGVKGGKYLLILTQDTAGSRMVAWPSSVRWNGDSLPGTLTTTAGRTDYVGFFFNGLTYDVLSLAQDY